eukprot:gnl/Carplike_NY0171/3577_a4831_274.p1 GENE.gnl/Carplike_NY0171/3577_a4831_274~~gnl/Carplike_NY0171/3577_a4831_274.p1  ORF type:complete len:135 (-),score=27.18 gnl/Carplike_NY0171/3577_a4831_274:246-650(-)
MSAMSGGSAQLSAIEGEDEHQMPDVELNVIHPHDSFRAISELSGGQQSIVGLAFLFALFSYKPAPFLILDEVDAALDAENVSKIGSFIEKHLTTQYIVISLKDKLYRRAQRLIGVCKRRQDGDKEGSKIFLCDL